MEMRRAPRTVVRGALRIRERCSWRRSGLLRLPEDLVDLVDLGEQRVRGGHVGAALGAAATARQLGGFVEQLAQLWVLLEVRRLEVIRPQHPQMVLDEFGLLLLDQQRAGPERRVVVVVVLLDDRFNGLGLDPGLGRIVDTAGQVAVSVRGGPRLEETCEQPHRSPSLMSDHGLPVSDTTPSTLRETREGCMRWPLWRVTVTEQSMEPALGPGDWLLVRRAVPPGRPGGVHPGQVVVR